MAPPLEAIEKARVLIVDDHPNVARTLARALEKAHFATPVEILTAQNGPEALEANRDRSIDILITDLLMPGMSGLNLIETLNEQGTRPGYIVLITAYDAPDLGETVQGLHVDKYLAKPVRPETLQAIVGRLLDGISPAAHSRAEVDSPSKILIADDHPDNQRLLSIRLRNDGYTFFTACDGADTLEKVHAIHPDLILLDINMPKKNGLEVLAEIRADPEVAHIPVIVLTSARVGPQDVLTGLNLGADDYITKPFDWNELAARVRAKLRVKKAEDVMRRRNRELSVLPEIGQDLSARLDLDDLAHILLERMVTKWGADDGYLLLEQPNDELFVRSFRKQMSAAEAQAFGREALRTGIAAQALLENQSILVADTAADQLWQDASRSSFRSLICVPLMGRSSMLGALTLVSEQPDFFHREHVPLLQAIASQASIAVENAHLYNKVARDERRLSAVLHSAADAILVMDGQGRLILANPAGQQLFSGQPVEIGQPVPSSAEYDDLLGLFDEIRFSEQPGRAELPWMDGRTFHVQVTPVEANGQVAVFHDITHFKELERIKNEFIAATSHDLKNPINAVIGFSALLEQAGPLNEKQQLFVDRLRQAANQMHELTLNLMELMRKDIQVGAPDYVACDLAALADQTVDELKILSDRRRQSIAVQAADVPVVMGEPERLRQVFRNLIGNAIKYTQQGGDIQVQVATRDRYAEVRVVDNGIGIPEDEIPNLFRTFYRVSSAWSEEVEGNGLGLAIVKSIVEQHHGEVSVVSTPGAGSQFIVTLPLDTSGRTNGRHE